MLKKTVCSAAAFIALFLLSAAPVSAADPAEPMEVAVSRNFRYESDDTYYVTLANSEWPGFHLVNESAAAYPQLDAALAQINSDYAAEMEASFASLCEQAVSYYDTVKNSDNFDPYESWYGYTDEATGFVRRADSKVLSLLYYSFTYSGGAHGYYGYTGKNLDPQTGALLTIDDVISDRSALKPAVQEQLDRFFPDLEVYDPNALDRALSFEPDYSPSWTLDYNGLTLYFDPYILGSYAAGAQVITLTFDQYPNLLRPEYRSECSAYGVSLTTSIPYYTDLNGDGSLDSLELYSMNDFDTDTAHLTFLINGTRIEDNDSYFFGVSPSLLHTEDGHTFLYADTLIENDYHNIIIYDLSDGTVSKVTDFFGGAHDFYPMFGEIPTRQAFTSPQHIRLDTRYDMLSTISASNVYTVGPDGQPVPQSDIYQLNIQLPLTLKTTLSAEVVDEATGLTTGTAELEPGMVLTTEQTDLATWTDLRCEDGTLCRVYVNKESWPRTINGVDIMEIFDGCIYAG